MTESPQQPSPPPAAAVSRRVTRAEAEEIVRQHVAAGRLEPALSLQRRIAAAHPRDARAQQALALLLRDAGQLAEAVEALDRALAVTPRESLLLSQRSELLRRLDRLAEALADGEAAWRLEPHRPHVLVALGSALLALGEAARAQPLLRTAMARAPGDIETLARLGDAERLLGRLEAAAEVYRAVLALDQRRAETHCALGFCLRDLGNLAGARRHFEQALWLDPGRAEARLAIACLTLQEGRFAEGWPDFEARRLLPGAAAPPELPAWAGEELAGRHLFLRAESGHGDTLQFCRYLPLLQAAGARVTCEVQPALLRLLADSFPGVTFHTPGTPPPAADAWAPLPSLPGLFQTGFASLPSQVPYLRIRPAARQAWRERLDALAPRAGLRIGLAWAGDPRNPGDALRSFTPATLAPLRALPEASFFSLQLGERQGEAASWPSGGAPLHDLAPMLGDFAETAGAVCALDVIVTADTALAHLAGALARPAALLLARVPDWRWLLGRDDSPWYPGLWLFRQPAPGDWRGAVAEALASLRAQAPALIDWREAERAREAAEASAPGDSSADPL